LRSLPRSACVAEPCRSRWSRSASQRPGTRRRRPGPRCWEDLVAHCAACWTSASGAGYANGMSAASARDAGGRHGPGGRYDIESGPVLVSPKGATVGNGSRADVAGERTITSYRGVRALLKTSTTTDAVRRPDGKRLAPDRYDVVPVVSASVSRCCCDEMLPLLHRHHRGSVIAGHTSSIAESQALTRRPARSRPPTTASAVRRSGTR
jgi:hypothetical protein